MNKLPLFKSSFIILLTVVTQSVLADNVVVNNNNNQQQPTQQCGGGNQNDIYDKRVPPAGTYVLQHGNGSSDTLYTTGEKKPYYVDSNCSSTSTTPSTILVQPTVGGGERR